MHELTVLVGAASVEAVSDLLCDEHGALSVSIEDADAGSADEQPVFGEPGIAGSDGLAPSARSRALFADEAAADLRRGGAGGERRRAARRGSRRSARSTIATGCG